VQSLAHGGVPKPRPVAVHRQGDAIPKNRGEHGELKQLVGYQADEDEPDGVLLVQKEESFVWHTGSCLLQGVDIKWYVLMACMEEVGIKSRLNVIVTSKRQLTVNSLSWNTALVWVLIASEIDERRDLLESAPDFPLADLPPGPST
jgi:hypothetical protein